jgi:penicillin-binding protein 1C
MSPLTANRVTASRLLAAAAGISIPAVAFALAVAARTTAPAPPDFAAVRAGYCPSDARVLDRTGRVIHEQRVDPTRRRLPWTASAAVSPALITAVLASEDRRFFAHGGVDGRAAAAAVWQWLGGGGARGASTITMQVAALLDPALQRGAGPRSALAKWRQMRAAWALERAWSKDEILEAYLNLVSFRGEVQGVAAAAELGFGKAPDALTRPESAVLAALLRAPNADRDALCRRAGALLGDADGSALVAAVDRAFATRAGTRARTALAPHAARRLLPATGPAPCTDTPSTLDADAQRYATESLRRHLLAVSDRSVRDGAVLVADNATGDVIAYVGASGSLSAAPQVDGVQARRQAGSTLKPFLYALAIDRRLLTAASLLDDSPFEIAAGNGVFRPRDYDEQFRGIVSLRRALAGSLNVPAVRTILLVEPETFADTLRAFGVALPRPGDYYGPSLALGSADVSLWELVGAYRALANGGRWSPLHLNPSARHAPARPAVGGAAAFITADVLADRESRSGTFGLESPLATRFWSAVKTGTSKDMRDNWCIGFSRRYTVGVWVGNFSGAPMRNVSGVTGAAPVWEDVMSWLHRNAPSAAPAPPDGVRRAAARFTDGVEPPRDEWFVAGTEPAAGAVGHGGAPRITTPSDGSVLAVDPDIPAERQRVPFAADVAPDRWRWRLDGRDIGAAAGIFLWPPTHGAHRLELVDRTDRVVQSVAFEVRGGVKE